MFSKKQYLCVSVEGVAAPVVTIETFRFDNLVDTLKMFFSKVRRSPIRLVPFYYTMVDGKPIPYKLSLAVDGMGESPWVTCGGYSYTGKVSAPIISRIFEDAGIERLPNELTVDLRAYREQTMFEEEFSTAAKRLYYDKLPHGSNKVIPVMAIYNGVHYIGVGYPAVVTATRVFPAPIINDNTVVEHELEKRLGEEKAKAFTVLKNLVFERLEDFYNGKRPKDGNTGAIIAQA